MPQHDKAVRDAWNLYLKSTRGVDPIRYAEIEPWAWKRLEAALKKAKRVVANAA